jgi:hypothetical protein
MRFCGGFVGSRSTLERERRFDNRHSFAGNDPHNPTVPNPGRRPFSERRPNPWNPTISDNERRRGGDQSLCPGLRPPCIGIAWLDDVADIRPRSTPNPASANARLLTLHIAPKSGKVVRVVLSRSDGHRLCLFSAFSRAIDGTREAS